MTVRRFDATTFAPPAPVLPSGDDVQSWLTEDPAGGLHAVIPHAQRGVLAPAADAGPHAEQRAFDQGRSNVSGSSANGALTSVAFTFETGDPTRAAW